MRLGIAPQFFFFKIKIISVSHVSLNFSAIILSLISLDVSIFRFGFFLQVIGFIKVKHIVVWKRKIVKLNFCLPAEKRFSR